MDDTELALMAKQGLPVGMIAQEMGVNVTTVYRRLHDLGIPVPGPDRLPLTPEQRKELVRRRLDGETTALLCHEYHLAPLAFNRIMMSEGVDILTLKYEEKQAKEKQYDLAIQMYQKGNPIWQIAQETGLNATTIIAEVHRRRIPLRSQNREKRKPDDNPKPKQHRTPKIDG